MSLLLVGLAEAHSVSFGARGVSVSGEEVWAIVDGWGVVHSDDAGETFRWQCEEALGDAPVYDVVALGDGAAVLATGLGVLRVDDSCASTLLGGFPDNTYATLLARWGDGLLVGAVGSDAGGILACDADTCAPTELWGPGIYPKSLRVDEARVWATFVEGDTLASSLLVSDDGAAWDVVYEWPDGSVGARLFDAERDRLWIWAAAQDEAHTPALLVSDDDGVTFTETFATGTWLDAAPGFVRLGDTVLLGSARGALTWRSDDGGRTFTDVSAEAPAVRCGAVADGVAWTCGDHLADGFDLATTTNGTDFETVACLQEAALADCAADTCTAAYDAFVNSGSIGGGECAAVTTEEPAPSPCGCGGGGALGLVLAGVATGSSGRRSGRRPLRA